MGSNKLKVIHTIINGKHQFWTSPEREGRYIPLDDRYFCKEIPLYHSFNEQARKRARKKYLKRVKIIKTIWISGYVPNIKKKLYEEHFPKPKPFLQLSQLHEKRPPGYLLIANVLSSMHTEALRKIEPNFRPVLSISCDAPKNVQILLDIMSSLFPERTKKIGHRTKLKRQHILDYRAKCGEFPHYIQDFSSGAVKIKHQKKFRFIAPYTDSAVLLIGANSAQIREADSYLQNAGIILLNSSPGELNPTKLPTSVIESYDPTIVEQLTVGQPQAASLLRWWCELFDDEEAWARQIVQAARASFGKPDSCYIRVELDPKKLRNAILYQVFLSFLDEVEAAEFMSAEELAPYRQGAKEVFDPAPPEPVQLRHAEDPDVFLEIMKTLAENSSAHIVAENTRFVKKDKPLAAWRTINGERYLVFLEADWARTYLKLVRAHKDVECSYFQREHWERDIQKLLCEQNLIKAASSGYRYRYDLMENGTRDTTYVVAIPAHLLEN